MNGERAGRLEQRRKQVGKEIAGLAKLKIFFAGTRRENQSGRFTHDSADRQDDTGGVRCAHKKDGSVHRACECEY